METLNLNVEDAVGVKNDTGVLLNVLAEASLILLLYSEELLENSLIVLELSECLKLSSVLDELITDSLGEELCESGVGLIEPSSLRDTVSNVLELIRSIEEFLVEY